MHRRIRAAPSALANRGRRYSPRKMPGTTHDQPRNLAPRTRRTTTDDSFALQRWHTRSALARHLSRPR
jgi:hypothetical protein